MNELLKQLLKNDANVSLRLDEETDQIIYVLSGFYKYGEVKMYENEDGSVRCLTRYNIVENIESWEDMVRWNHSVWMSYKNSFSGWSSPESVFLNSMLELGLVKANTVTTTTYS